MLRILLAVLLVLHGAIHLMGFAKAYGYARIPSLTLHIARPMGVLWAITSVLFGVAAVELTMSNDGWWMPAAAALLLSQLLIVRYWRDARFGTIANALLLLVVIAGAGVRGFRAQYTAAVERTVERTRELPAHHITEAEITPLPQPVQRFLRTAGVVGTTVPRNMRIVFAGELRGFDGPWMPFTTVQTNSFDEPARFFWIDATMKGMPTKGLHAYENGTATMLIKALGLVPVMEAHGAEMDTAETVTWFNDLCLFAPGALLDPRITWSPMDERSAKATFTHRGITIRAVLMFDAADHLVDFISDDRYALENGRAKKLRFSTPARDHRRINGLLLPGYGEAVWHRPEGPLIYGRFTLRSIVYDIGAGRAR
ncbi:MAG: DUF6544 family protein [Flavobacteriales bacterium]